MNDVDLDELLRSSAPVPSATAQELAIELARELETAPVAATVPGVRRRRRKQLATAAAAMLLLTAGTTVAAYQLSVPPFQTLPEGLQRAEHGIPITYTNSLGREVECLLFIETRNLDEGQRAVIEELARDPRWEGYGERVLADQGMAESPPLEQNHAVSDALTVDVEIAVEKVLPEIALATDRRGPAYNGYAFSCPEGADGRP